MVSLVCGILKKKKENNLVDCGNPFTTYVCVCVHIIYIYIYEGNGNPLQYSCPENPMDRGAW